MSLKLAPSDYEIYIPIAEWVEKNIKEWLFMQRPLFKKLSTPIDTVLNGLESLFNIIPFPIAILIFVYFAYKTNGLKFTILTVVGLIFIDLVDLWSESMTTLAMIFTAVIFCIIIGIPLGILCSRSKIFETIMRPILDVMQTIPSFVYLIPVMMLFGITDTSVLIAVIVYATIPATRYTIEGLRSVPPALHDAASMSGVTRLQRLFKIEFPLAFPHIMLGINQTVAFALFMVIIGAFIGTEDLGQYILKALSDNKGGGKGLILGRCVAFIGLAVDNLIRTWANKRKKLLGLEE